MYKIEIVLSESTPDKYVADGMEYMLLLKLMRVARRDLKVGQIMGCLTRTNGYPRPHFSVDTVSSDVAIVDRRIVYVGTYALTITFDSKREAQIFKLKNLSLQNSLKKFLTVVEHHESEVANV